mgnify:FL=1|jgi:hypothetical protein
MGDAARMKNKFFGGILLVLLCGFYIIPLVAVALLANLAALYVTLRSRTANNRGFGALLTVPSTRVASNRRSAYVGFINTWVNDYQWTFSAFVGTLIRIPSSSASLSHACQGTDQVSSFSPSGVVPPILTLLLQMILPMIIRCVDETRWWRSQKTDD